MFLNVFSSPKDFVILYFSLALQPPDCCMNTFLGSLGYCGFAVLAPWDGYGVLWSFPMAQRMLSRGIVCRWGQSHSPTGCCGTSQPAMPLWPVICSACNDKLGWQQAGGSHVPPGLKITSVSSQKIQSLLEMPGQKQHQKETPFGLTGGGGRLG